MPDKAYIEALEHYHKLVQEHERLREAYRIDPSHKAWEKLQESIIELKRQDDVIRLYRWLESSKNIKMLFS